MIVSAIAGITFGSVPAGADADPPPPATVSADALPTVQVNGVVWSQTVVGNTVYATGSFTKARPAGTATGDPAEVPRSNLLAYDITTGNLITSFDHTLNAQGLVVTASPDGSTVYVGGDFSIVDGVTRQKIAAFSTATGALIPTFRPSVASQVRAIAATNSTVYAGGNFLTVNSVARTRLAAFRASDGALLDWAPTADNLVNALLISPDGSKVVAGGRFANLGGAASGGIGALDAATGAVQPWNAAFPLRDTGDNAGFTSLTTDGTNLYGTGFNFHGNGGSGNFEGRFGSDFAGNLVWLDSCHGDSYSSFVQGPILYSAHHAHDCSDVGAYDDTTPRTFHRVTAETLTPSGEPLLANTNAGYSSFAGQPGNTLLHWWPAVAAGTYTGQTQGAWSVSGNDKYVVFGGEFPTINYKAQQGLVRFAVRSIAPNKQPPYVSAAMTATATSQASGTARVRWQSTWDADDATLQYLVYRDNGTTPVYTTSATTNFWTLPYLGFVDTGLDPGSTHTYRVSVVDPSKNKINAPASAPVTISSTPVPSSAYSQAVLADGASEYWQLNEPGGSTAYDSSPSFDDLTLGSGATFGTDGPLAGQSAATFSGTSSGTSNSSFLQYGPDAFTIEAWFKTNTTSGGKIIGFGDTAAAASVNDDRQIYLDNAGRVLFGVDTGLGTKATITSTAAFNNNAWHQVVATLPPTGGIALYVDGLRVARDQSVTTARHYQGYWRIGGDSVSGWPSAPASAYFRGSIAAVSVNPSALDVAAVQSHYSLSGRATGAPGAPSDAYGQSVYSDNPDLYWRLNDTSGTTAADSSRNAAPGVYTLAGVAKGVSPAFATSGNAVRFDGASGGLASATAVTNPISYSTEAWFKTTSTRGGKIIGFGSSQIGSSTNYDRQVFMTASGQLVFGANNSPRTNITSSGAYNDGQWHQVVATQGPAGMTLYVDGRSAATNTYPTAQKYNGYWRVGSDRADTAGTSSYFAGTIDEVSVYPVALGADRVLAHYSASGTGAGNQAPTAAFATPTCTYLSCVLDASASSDPDGEVQSYAWDFGDGTTGTGATTSHAYAAAGTYTVTLTVTDDSGATASTTRTVVTVAKPTATFTANCLVHTCSLDASSSTPGSGAITDYGWDFGDGTAGSGATVSHEYATAGPRTVTLTITDSVSGTATTTKTVNPVDNQAPTASFTVACSNASLTCSVNATASSDPDGTISDYSWDFGDNTPAGSGVTTSHDYAVTGSYPITLTVTDNLGAKRTKTITSVAGDIPPTASFTQNCSNLSCGFDGSASSDPDGTVASYAWNFGDSTTGTGATTTHAYAAAGTYTVTLTVTDNLGATGTTSQSVVVTAPPATAAFATDAFNRTVASGLGTADTGGAWTTSGTTSVSPGTGKLVANAGGSAAGYLNSVSQSDADITATIKLDKAPTGGGSYVYVIARRPGTNREYRAVYHLLANGTVGILFQKLDNSTTETIIKAETTISGLTYTAGAKLRIRVQATGTNPTTLRARAWTDGTAEPTTWTTITDSSASLQTPGGIGLRAYHSGSTTNAPITTSISDLTAKATTTGGGGPTPNVSPTAAFTQNCLNLSCGFDGSASSDPDGTVASYAWNFGDSTTGTGATTTHAYAAAGTYTVTLTVTDNLGATGTTSQSVVVTAPPATAAFATDAFNRTVASGLGTADTGGAWTTSGTTSVSPGTGKLVANAGGSAAGYLNSVSQSDADITATIKLDKAPTGGGSYVYVIARRPGTNREYRAVYHLLANGTVGILFQKLDNSTTETIIKAETTISGLTYTAGAKLRIRVQATGTNPTTLRARAWTDGTAEPTTWTTITDSSASLQTPGGIGLRAYHSGSTTNAPITTSISDLTAKPSA